MLSLFPTLLSWSELSPFLIRLTLGAIFIYWSYRAFRKRGEDAHNTENKLAALLEGIIGILFVIGLWTQATAIVAGIDLIVRLIRKIMARSFLSGGVNYYLILLVLCVSLLVTGAGLWAFDIAL